MADVVKPGQPPIPAIAPIAAIRGRVPTDPTTVPASAAGIGVEGDAEGGCEPAPQLFTACAAAVFPNWGSATGTPSVIPTSRLNSSPYLCPEEATGIGGGDGIQGGTAAATMPAMVRSARPRKTCLILAKASSIGLQSGE